MGPVQSTDLRISSFGHHPISSWSITGPVVLTNPESLRGGHMLPIPTIECLMSEGTLRRVNEARASGSLFFSFMNSRKSKRIVREFVNRFS